MNSTVSEATGSLAEGAAPLRSIRLAGTLLIGGFLLNLVVTMLFHPSGAEDTHTEIFAEYAASDGWAATHIGQFLGVSAALAGLMILVRALRAGSSILAQVAVAALIVTASVYAVLQAVDGVALKQATEAWVGAAAGEESTRFSGAEIVRWTEWGIQSYFRILLGISLLLVGAAMVGARVVAGWLGWSAVLAGLLSVAVGIAVGYTGLESDFWDPVGLVAQLLLFVFAVGVLVAGIRGPRSRAIA